MTSMIDVVFLLLIFFLVTYQITEQEKDLRIQLPSTAEGSQEVRVANKIVVNISKDKVITIDGRVFTLPELRETLDRIVKAAELAGEGAADRQPIRVRGDTEWEYGEIMKVIDEIKRAGIWNVDLTTRTPTPR